MSGIRFRVCVMVCLVIALKCGVARSQYQTAEEAWRAGAAQLAARNYVASQAPLEAALGLATDDAFRLKVYEALLPAYRMLPEPDKFIEASDFLISKTPSVPKRSLTRRSLLSFVHQRGRTDQLAHQYEEDLKRDPQDRTALYILSELYSQTKRDPERAADRLQRLVRLDEKEGVALDVPQSAELARQYVLAKRFVDGAALYEKIAPLDEKLAAWHWKEAAAARIGAGEKDKAVAAARQADAAPPEKRTEQLSYFWHRGLADVYLAGGEPKLAIPHYQQAIEKTTIAGYLEQCRKSLAEARTQAGL